MGPKCIRGGGNVTMKAEIGAMWPQANECQELPDAGRSKERTVA